MSKYTRYVFLIAFVFFVLSVPEEAVSHIRNGVISSISPAWKLLNKQTNQEENTIETLEVENQILHHKIERLHHWITQDQHLQKQMQHLLSLKKEQSDPFIERRQSYLSQILAKQLHGLPAKVVFREPANWSSVIWIGVGNRDNRLIGEEIIAKNSPVVIGNAVVGVVETVLENRSSVRLITDRALTPSVRGVRGNTQNKILLDQLGALIQTLSNREDLYGAKEIADALESFSGKIDLDRRDSYLAKGHVQGASRPLWRMLGQTLKGIGFNYDFADVEGPARDLQTTHESLLCVGDVLVTTGMDGVFPADLHIATVTKVHPLQEGECSYSIEAEALAPNLNSLSEVFVLPPL